MDSDYVKSIKKAAALIEFNHGAPMSALSDCLRGFLIPAEGKRFIAADFSNIEGRVLAWLAGEEWKLEAFRQFDLGIGADIYVLSYARSFHVPIDQVDDQKRQVGKVQELSMGFGGGKGAFQSMAKNYNVKVSDKVAEENKVAWRGVHPATVQYWCALEAAATNAILYPGKIFSAGHAGREVKYRVNGSFLWCLLPSGRALCYPYPKIEPSMKPWGDMLDSITYMYIDSLTNKWVRGSTYGGSLAENCTQAVARDFLTEAMLRVEDAGYHVVIHIHDEAVCEVAQNFGSLKEFEQIVSVLPVWAAGMPVAAKGWEGHRYRK